MKKRRWVYVHHPTRYDIRCDHCWNGEINNTGINIDWSEYEHMIWCYDCKQDLPGFSGVFDGPIPMGLNRILGISFNRIYLKSGKMFKPMTTTDGKRIVYRRCSKADVNEFTLVKFLNGKERLEICTCGSPIGPCHVHGKVKRVKQLPMRKMDVEDG
jgi:hypothetical protein